MRGLTAAPPGPPTASGISEVVVRLTEHGLPRRERAGLLARLVGLLLRAAKESGTGAMSAGRWATDLLLEVAPHLPVRDRAALQAAYGGLVGEALAEAMIRAASKATAAVGAAGGALSAAQMAAPPTLLATPVQLVAETVAVVAIEVRLVAELHEAYGVVVQGSPTERGAAFVQSWMSKRSVDVFAPEGSRASALLGTAVRRQLRARLLRRLGRNLSTVAPFLAGAVVGAELNRRETLSLGERVAADLRPLPRR